MGPGRWQVASLKLMWWDGVLARCSTAWWDGVLFSQQPCLLSSTLPIKASQQPRYPSVLGYFCSVSIHLTPALTFSPITQYMFFFSFSPIRSHLQRLRGELWGSSRDHLQRCDGGRRPDAQCLCSKRGVPHLLLWHCGRCVKHLMVTRWPKHKPAELMQLTPSETQYFLFEWKKTVKE